MSHQHPTAEGLVYKPEISKCPPMKAPQDNEIKMSDCPPYYGHGGQAGHGGQQFEASKCPPQFEASKCPPQFEASKCPPAHK